MASKVSARLGAAPESCSANKVSGLPGRSISEVYPPQEGLVLVLVIVLDVSPLTWALPEG
jgi:hypothetical protein